MTTNHPSLPYRRRTLLAARWDAGLNYRRKNWDFALTCENLTDVIFVQAAIAPGSNTVDSPRTVYLSATVKY